LVISPNLAGEDLALCDVQRWHWDQFQYIIYDCWFYFTNLLGDDSFYFNYESILLVIFYKQRGVIIE